LAVLKELPVNGKQILQSLKLCDLSFTDIANALEVTPATISMVAHRRSDSRRIAEALAMAIGKPIEKVFPDRPQYHRHIDQAERQRRLDAIREISAA
jgi:transcriptional regulator with XRE-family HTH domain